MIGCWSRHRRTGTGRKFNEINRKLNQRLEEKNWFRMCKKKK